MSNNLLAPLELEKWWKHDSLSMMNKVHTEF